MKVRKMSISTKLLLLITVVNILCTVTLGGVIYSKLRTTFISQFKLNALEMAACAANTIDGDMLDMIEIGSEDTPEYNAIYDELSVYRDNSSIMYIYTMKGLDDGSVVFLIDTDEEEPADIYEEYEALDEILVALNGENSAANEFTVDEWGTYFSSYSPVYNSKGEVAGVVGVDIGADWIDEQLAVIRNTMIIIGIIVVLMGTICAIVISRSIRRNLNKLNGKVIDLNSGNGDLTKEVEMNSGDELELIADNMNRFIGEIRGLVSNVSETSSSIAQSGNLMLSTVEYNASNIGDINSNISNLSANMEECTASSELVSSNLENVVANVNMLTHKTREVKDYTYSIKLKSDKIVSDVNDNRNNAENKINVIQERIALASENARKIELVQEMAKKIEDIASQTQILSLNASIEAARAGETGRGFAVVAESVGSLSIEIENAVREINKTSNEVTEAVNELLEEVTVFSDFVNTNVVSDYEVMVDISKEYGGNVNHISKEIADIEKETTTINQTISNISQSIGEISQAVYDSTESITEINSLADMVNNSMQELNSSAEQNETYVEQLNEKVNRYTF